MNPFRDTIVASPWQPTGADVPEIHRTVFDKCLEGVEEVRNRQRSAAILIHGEAGSGKTHLLHRLRKELTRKAPTATDRDESLFVWVRLQTSPRTIWRHVRQTLVDDWFRSVREASSASLDGLSQFDRVLLHRLARFRPAEGDIERWYEYMGDTDPDGLDKLLETVSTEQELDRNTAIAFKHLAFGRHRRDLQAWLAGNSLPEKALEVLGFSPDEGTDEDREHEARKAVLRLCRLAGNDLPIVFSLDQVEALQSSPTDTDGLFAFGQLVSTLHDETTNVLLISCVQSAFATALEDRTRGADHDRMTSLGKLNLETLTRAQAERLIAVRLKAMSPTDSTASFGGACWPLEEQELTSLLERGDLTPRRLLARCVERFETRREPSTATGAEPRREIPTSTAGTVANVRTFLDGEWDARVQHSLSGSKPERTEDILRHGLPLLFRLIAPDMKVVRDEQLPDVPLVLELPAGRVGLTIRTEPNMKTVGTKFGHLKQQWALGRLARLIVVRDSRVPLTKTAKVAQKNLDELEQQGAVIAHPNLEALAALDALRGLLSDAKSGDLDNNGVVITPQTVEEWVLLNLPDSLRELAEQLTGQTGLTGTPPARDWLELEELSGLLSGRPLVSVEEAAGLLKRSLGAITATVQRHPDLFGLLVGPPAVVFRISNDGQ